MVKKKRTITAKDVGKVFRWRCPPSYWACFFSAGGLSILSDGALLLVCPQDEVFPRFEIAYLYMPQKKRKWVRGTIDKGPRGYWEELAPLEVLILCGASLPKAYKRKQFK